MSASVPHEIDPGETSNRVHGLIYDFDGSHVTLGEETRRMLHGLGEVAAESLNSTIMKIITLDMHRNGANG